MPQIGLANGLIQRLAGEVVDLLAAMIRPDRGMSQRDQSCEQTLVGHARLFVCEIRKMLPAQEHATLEQDLMQPHGLACRVAEVGEDRRARTSPACDAPATALTVQVATAPVAIATASKPEHAEAAQSLPARAQESLLTCCWARRRPPAMRARLRTPEPTA